MSDINIRGARTHNLKNLDISLPRDKLIVITGLSGSGKSSLAFDTLYAEGQRRYVESLSAYARQFLSVMQKPDVDHIEGLSPAISIEQKATSHNPRSTVGTITEIYDYLRLMYARVGRARCPEHGAVLEAQTISQMVDTVLALPEGSKIMLLAPVVQSRKGEFVQLLQDLQSQGFVRARIDGKVVSLDESPTLALRKKHTIEVVVDRIKVRAEMQQRLAESFETALQITDGIASVTMTDGDQPDLVFSAKLACPQCGYSMTELEPRLFSFNNPVGACETCNGLGVQQLFDRDKVVHDDTLSMAAGAVRGWDRRNFYYFQMMQSMAVHYDFNIETPFGELSKKIRDVVLYGSGEEVIHFRYVSARGKVIERNHTFEGVLPNLNRRYHETESHSVREDMAKYLTVSSCEACKGERLKLGPRNVFVGGKSLPEVVNLPIEKACEFFEQLELPGKRGEIANKILVEINSRLSFLLSVGLSYLSLARSADTLSGGEAQRIRLASQIGSGLVGVMYILDEPSIGLHQRDNERLLQTLERLRDLGNTVIVVEHDEDAILRADYVLDIGPGAGIHGGEVVAEGKPIDIMRNDKSLTGKYLSRQLLVATKKRSDARDPAKILRLNGAHLNNLKKINVSFPIGLMTCITGVSGSGKSSLINDTLYPAAAKALNKASLLTPGPYEKLTGLGHLDKVIAIDQSPIGRTPRSNPATYTGLFTPIRDLFAGTPESRARGYLVGRFSFNVKGGRCEACEGEGMIKVEMHFLADMYVDCDVCRGKRYNRETLEVTYKGKTIHDVLQMTVEVACEFFAPVPQIARKLQTLIDVGLSYIHLGQSATTLSGGEAQRIKLARELSKRGTGQTLYILDEPTTGLHFHDIKQLLEVLHRLRDQGNTIIVIEHNLDVILAADWIIDLGPEGGDQGGEVVAKGTPEEVMQIAASYTGQFLQRHVDRNEKSLSK